MLTWGRYYWPVALLFMAVVMIGIPETIAIITNPANTLSDYSWDELRVGFVPVHTIAWYVSLAVWLTAIVLLTLHIWWRWSLPESETVTVHGEVLRAVIRGAPDLPAVVDLADDWVSRCPSLAAEECQRSLDVCRLGRGIRELHQGGQAAAGAARSGVDAIADPADREVSLESGGVGTDVVRVCPDHDLEPAGPVQPDVVGGLGVRV